MTVMCTEELKVLRRCPLVAFILHTIEMYRTRRITLRYFAFVCVIYCCPEYIHTPTSLSCIQKKQLLYRSVEGGQDNTQTHLELLTNLNRMVFSFCSPPSYSPPIWSPLEVVLRRHLLTKFKCQCCHTHSVRFPSPA